MKIEQSTWSHAFGWKQRGGFLGGQAAQFVLSFDGRHLIQDPTRFQDLRDRYPGAHVLLSSTSGEITGTEITEDTLSVTVVASEKTRIGCAALSSTAAGDSHAVSAKLARLLNGPDIGHVFVISDGASTNNGTELVRECLGSGATMTGFYSYGELAPSSRETGSQLHNQTMTVTAFAEE